MANVSAGPNNQDGHPAEYCSPSTECQILRASGKVCEPQGIYEPVICTVGHYCPPPGKEQIRCPKGYFCPQGSFKPLKCSPAAVCPAGSSKKYDLTGLVFIILIDLAIMGFMVGPPLWKKIANISRRGRRMTDPEGERYKGTGASTPESAEYVELSPKDKAGGRGSAVFVDNIDNSEAEITDDLRLLIESFKKCNPGENNVGLTFDFQDMGFTVKGGRQLLSAVNGKIEAGTMWGVMGPSGAGKSA